MGSRHSVEAMRQTSVSNKRSRQAIISALCISLVLGVVGCVETDSNGAEAATVVEAGKATFLTSTDGRVEMIAAPGVLPAGRVSMRRVNQPVAVPATVDAPIEIDTDSGLINGVIELRFKPTGRPDATATVATWDEAAREWVPIETVADGDWLVARVAHLSLWTTITGCLRLGDSANVCELFLNRLLGVRAEPPTCDPSTKVPSWVEGSNTDNTAASQQVYTCLSGDGDDLVVHVVNNRGYAVSLGLSTSAEASYVDSGWPSGVDQLVAILAKLIPGAGKHEVLLPPTGSVTVRFARPARTGQIQGYAHDTPLSLLAYVLSEAVGVLNPSYTFKNGWKITTGATDCILALSSVQLKLLGGTARTASNAADAIEAVLRCLGRTLAEQLPSLVAAGASSNDIALLSAVKNRLWWYQAVRYVHQVADRILDAQPPLRNSPDLSVNALIGDWSSVAGTWSSVYGSVTFAADGFGTIDMESWNSCTYPIYPGKCDDGQVQAKFRLTSVTKGDIRTTVQESQSSLLKAGASLRFIRDGNIVIYIDLGADSDFRSYPYFCSETGPFPENFECS